MAHFIPAYTPILGSQEFARGRGWGTSLKNVLFGSLENWRDHTLTIGAVYYVAQSIFFFIGGYWLYSVIGLCTAALMARMRKDLREFANLRKETGDYQKQNNSHRNINLQQKEITNRLQKVNENLENNVEQFTTQLKELQKESKIIHKENGKYAYHNKVHEKLISSLGKTAKQLASDITQALEEGTDVGKETLEGFYDALQQFEEQKKALGSITAELKQENAAALARFEKLASQIQKMDYRGVKAIRDADRELAKRLQAIEDATEELARIKDEIAEATKINKEAAEFSKKAAKESYEAAQKSNSAAGIFKMVTNTFFASSEVNPTTGEPYTDWGKVIVYAGAIAAISRWAIKV